MAGCTKVYAQAVRVGHYTASRFEVAAIVALTFIVIGLLVYFVAEKTLWELLALLVVPLALAVIGFAFTMQQDARQQKIENDRAASDRELAEQHARDDALQAYLDQMSTLVLEHNLRSPTEAGKETRTLARARTLAVLGSLGSDGRQPNDQVPDRKRTVVEFLYEASLINANKAYYIRLEDANMNHANLYYVNLEHARLPLVSLKSDYLFHAILTHADLGGAILSHANLIGAHLSDTNLHTANLSGADLSGTNLSGAYKRNNEGAKQPITNEELEQQACSLKGAIMPDGSNHP
jgi:uncharacterized protein YjbI with pentapeptide repeats